MNVLLTIAVVSMALFCWVSLFKIVPDCMMSLYRHRLWRLRDEVFDEIRASAYRDAEQPEKLICEVERHITYASELSFLNLALASMARRGVPIEYNPISFTGLCHDDRQRLGAHLKEFHDATFSKVLLGSPSGWVVMIPAFPIAAVAVLAEDIRERWAVRSKRPPTPPKRDLRNEAELRITESSRRLVNKSPHPRNREPISQFV